MRGAEEPLPSAMPNASKTRFNALSEVMAGPRAARRGAPAPSGPERHPPHGVGLADFLQRPAHARIVRQALAAAGFSNAVIAMLIVGAS